MMMKKRKMSIEGKSYTAGDRVMLGISALILLLFFLAIVYPLVYATILSSCCPCLFAPIALFSANSRYISIKSPFLTKILTHSLYYGKRAVG